MKILAMDKMKPGITFDDLKPHLKEEAKYAWNMYKKGITRELYIRGDQKGAVLIMEIDSIETARKMFDNLPLVKNNLIEFDYIVLEPFYPFETIFEK